MNEKTEFENIKKVGVVSDLHIPLKAKEVPEMIINRFKEVDLIIIAGDIVSNKVIEELEKLAPVVAVHGNMDPPEVSSRLPKKITIQVNNFKIGIAHGHGSAGETKDYILSLFPDVDCIIFGHIHKPVNEMHNNQLIFNPGSPTDHQFTQINTFGILTIKDKIHGEHIQI